jgi:hypothetical protein
VRMIKRYRKLPVEIEAAQWDGTPEQARRLTEWTMTADGGKHLSRFIMLGSDLAERLFGQAGAQTPPVDSPVTRHRLMLDNGATAALFVAANDEWLGIQTGEWVARDSAGFYPIKPEIFAQSYEELSP